MLADLRVKIRDIADIVHISTERIQNILHEKLGMRKISARWVPRLLTVEQKRNRMTTSEHCLDMFKRNPKEFLRHFVTVNETWIHHYTQEMKEQSKQWTLPSERASKKAKTVPSAGKIMATVFGIRKASSSPTIWRRAGQSRGSIMLTYWADSRLMMNGPIWRKKSALSPWQCISSLIRNCHSKTGRLALRTAASSTLFSRFDPMRFLFVLKYEQMAWWKAIHVKRGSHRRKYCTSTLSQSRI